MEAGTVERSPGRERLTRVGDVFVVGAGATGPESAGGGTADLAYAASTAALGDAGVAPADIPAVFVGSGPGGPPPTADAVAVRLGMRRMGFDSGGVEQLGTSAAEALHRGCQAIEMGVCDIVLCVGAQGRMNGDAPGTALLRERAASAQRYMTASGATVEHLARISAKNHRQGARNPRATRVREVTAAQVLESEVLDWPLTRLMIAPGGEGAAAIVLASGAARRRIGRRAARVRASLLVGPEEGHDDDSAARAARLAYRTAGVGPEDLDCAEVHDVTAAAELVAYEDLQLVPAGQGPELIDSGFTALGGVLPVNVSGGLLSLGEQPGASGIARICELVWQLRGEAGVRQVAGARVGLAQSTSRTADGGELVALTIVSAS